MVYNPLVSTRMVGPFRIVRELGEGGMGKVFLAYDEHLERSVVLKAIRPDLLQKESTRRRFRHEATLLARIEHPNVVPIYQAIAEPDGEYLAMGYVDGPNLHERLAADGPLTISDVLAIGEAVARGLAAIHRAGVLHRDLKSENVVVTHDGLVKIIDFGLAKPTEVDPEATALSVEGSTPGTPAAMSPEQACGQDLDERSDLFSLGVLLYEMIVGERPFSAVHQHDLLHHLCNKAHTPIADRRDGVPTALIDLVDALLAKVRDERPERARAVADRLEAIRRAVDAQNEASRVLGPDTNGSRNDVASGSGSHEQVYSVNGDAAGAGSRMPPPRAGKRIPRRWQAFLVGAVLAALTGAAYLLQEPDNHTRALERLRERDNTAAVTLLAAATAHDPNDVRAHATLAEAHRRRGYTQQARDAAQKALALATSASSNISAADSLLVQAIHHAVQDEWPEAVERYQALRALTPDDLDRGLDLIHAHLRANQPTAAQADLEAIAQQFGLRTDVRVLLLAARINHAMSDFRTTLERAREARAAAEKGSPAEAEAILLQAMAHGALGDLETSQVLARSIAADRNRLGQELLYNRTQEMIANHYNERGDAAAALPLYISLLAEYESRGDTSSADRVRGNLQAALQHLGRYREAAALSRIGEDPPSKLHQGQEQNLKGNQALINADLPGALVHYRRARELFVDAGDRANEATALVNMAEVQLLQGDLSNARATATQSRDLRIGAGTSTAFVWFILGSILAIEGNYEAAGRQIERALEEAEQRQDSYTRMAATLARATLELWRGNTRKARTLSHAAQQLARAASNPTFEARAMALNARCERDLGNHAAAREAMGNAFRIAQDSEDRELSFTLKIVDHLIRASQSPEHAARAMNELRRLARDAKNRDLILAAYEASLAEATIAFEQDDDSSKLEAVDQRAQNRGLNAFALRANRIAQDRSQSSRESQ